MNTIFDIDELVEHILSFVPRYLIGPSLLVNKRFNKMIKVDGDYKNVAKNGDLFSLTKITYSLLDALNIAKRFDNENFVVYLVKNHLRRLESGRFLNDAIRSLGYFGNENLYRKLESTEPNNNGYRLRIHELEKYERKFIEGLCEGMHVDLINKYKNKIRPFHFCSLVFNAYKQNNPIVIEKVNKFIEEFGFPSYKDALNEYVISGSIAKKTTTIDELRIILDDNTFDMEMLRWVCDGLVKGGHYDMYVWFVEQDEVKNASDIGTYFGALYTSIVNDDFRFFKHTYIEQNNLYRSDWNCYLIALNSIDYRRIDMLIFVIENCKFYEGRKDTMISLCESWGFDDIKNIIINHSHMFKKNDI